MAPVRHPLVVALPDGEDEALLRFGAREALQHGCGVHLVHAHPGDDRARAERVLASAVARTEVVAGPGVPVTGTTVVGPPVASVLRAAGDTRGVLVRQRDFLHLRHALEDDDHEGGRLPITCVPTRWSPVHDDDRPVLVGVGAPDAAEDLIGRALEVAQAHHTSLRILHAWHFPQPHDAVIEARVGPQWSDSVRTAIDRALARCRRHARAPVPADVVVRHGHPAEVLVEAARRAQVLVLERDRSRDGRVCIGRTTRAALHECPCPVLLLPATEGPRASGPKTLTDRSTRTDAGVV